MLKTFQLSLIFIFSIIVIGQQIKTPRPSPDATVTQMVGITEVSIDYSSPGVKGRKIFGELVPFGEVWRTGANEVTSITFSNPVKVNGNDLPAGTYGIHISGKLYSVKTQKLMAAQLTIQQKMLCE